MRIKATTTNPKVVVSITWFDKTNCCLVLFKTTKNDENIDDMFSKKENIVFFTRKIEEKNTHVAFLLLKKPFYHKKIACTYQNDYHILIFEDLAGAKKCDFLEIMNEKLKIHVRITVLYKRLFFKFPFEHCRVTEFDTNFMFEFPAGNAVYAFYKIFGYFNFSNDEKTHESIFKEDKISFFVDKCLISDRFPTLLEIFIITCSFDVFYCSELMSRVLSCASV